MSLIFTDHQIIGYDSLVIGIGRRSVSDESRMPFFISRQFTDLMGDDLAVIGFVRGLEEMMSPSFNVLGSVCLMMTRSPASKSVAFMESDSTMNALYPNTLRSARSNVMTEIMVNAIIPSENTTIAHTMIFLIIFHAFFIEKSSPSFVE